MPRPRDADPTPAEPGPAGLWRTRALAIAFGCLMLALMLARSQP